MRPRTARANTAKLGKKRRVGEFKEGGRGETEREEERKEEEGGEEEKEGESNEEGSKLCELDEFLVKWPFLCNE